MTLHDAFHEISQFWPGGQPFAFGHGAAAERLAAEYNRPLPEELRTYLDTIAPVEDVDFGTVGNPFSLYGLSRLGVRQDGYNWNSVTNYAYRRLASQLFHAGRRRRRPGFAGPGPA